MGTVPAPLVGDHYAFHGAKETGTNIHTVPLSKVYEQLGSTLSGLTQREAAERLRAVGPNTIRKIKGKSLLL